MHSDVRFKTDEQRIRPENSEVFRLWCDNTKIKNLRALSQNTAFGRDRKDGGVVYEAENLSKYKIGLYIYKVFVLKSIKDGVVQE
jgi:hypothetical protein